MRSAGRFLISGLLLSATTVVMRLVGVGYGVYLSGRLGAAGMGLFTLVTSVYNLAVTFAVSGISFAAMRMTAEAIGAGKEDTVRPILYRCLLYGLCFSLTAAVLLTVLARPIGEGILGEETTVRALRLLAPSLLPTALSSALHGYFCGVHRVAANAAVQLAGQICRIAVTASFLSFCPPDDLGSAIAIVSFGITCAELFCCVLHGILCCADLRRHIPPAASGTGSLTRALLQITLPMAVSTYARSGLLTAEHLLIPYGLRRSGASAEAALADYGTVHGMVFPLLLFPQALLGAFCGLLIPEVAEEKARGNEQRIRSIISRVFGVTLLFSIGCAAVILCFADEFGTAVYSSADAGRYIACIAPLIPVMYLDGAVDSILKGLGEQLYCMRVNIVDSLLGVLFAALLLPICGVKGYLISLYFCELTNAALSIARLVQVGGVVPPLFRRILLPMGTAFASCAAVRVAGDLFPFSIPDLRVTLAVRVTAAALLYFALLLATRCLRGRDLHWAVSLLRQKKENAPHAESRAGAHLVFFPFL